ncbi:MAG: molybdenum cofactor guanylyltransferase [Dehalococcoidia bacterium]
MTSIILAGGKSSRLGRNKALQVLDGKSLIQRVVDRLSVLSKEIVIVTAGGEPMPCSSPVTVKTVSDVYAGRGPLVGLYSGLAASTSQRAVVVGCDMPFLDTDLVRYMSQISSAFDAVVPRIEDKVEPLCAVYSTSCISAIQELLDLDELRINRLFSMVKVRYVGEAEVDRFDPGHLSFFNVNSKADLVRAGQIAAREGMDGTRA